MDVFCNFRPILITTGEPAGIGMDIVIDLVAHQYFSNLKYPIVITACSKALEKRVNIINEIIKYPSLPKWQVISDISEIQGHGLYILDVPTDTNVIPGYIDANNASMVLKQLEIAHNLAIDNKIMGVVTAPLQKSALIDESLTLPDGSMFSGHTEYFMQMSQCDKVVMMLANSKLKVALVTTHLPLSKVASAITKDEVKKTVQIVINAMRNQFNIEDPKILVCGLNPHAGEGGHLGMEEIDIINPVLQKFIDDGHNVSLAMPADTLFTERYLSVCDAVIAMYHDQGLPVLKSHGFGDSINLTLGLPYIRTSVDHGTALDLAGSGRADSSSLKQAINMLVTMSQK